MKKEKKWKKKHETTLKLTRSLKMMSCFYFLLQIDIQIECTRRKMEYLAIKGNCICLLCEPFFIHQII